jgi:peptidoglycan/LPS O-acetylase OafA/YrhL
MPILVVDTEQSAATIAPAEKRFYRPELDALRFVAFFGVLLDHALSRGNPTLDFISRMGSFGLSLFFMLSAYLITELLLREREKTGTVNWKAFFVRRALRIWPLYYGAIAAALAISFVYPPLFVSHVGIIEMSVFVGNISGWRLGILIHHLWSISVEEQFYLIWAPVMRFWGARGAGIASAIFIAVAGVWVLLFWIKADALWYATPIELLFFAGGSILALALHRREMRLETWSRIVLLGASAVYFIWAAQLNVFSPKGDLMHIALGYSFALVACVALFGAIYGVRSVPKWCVYLGKISYGLYVYHLTAVYFVEHFIVRLKINAQIGYLLSVVLSLTLTAAVASLSYQYFEKPFLAMKEKFAVVKSRPA